MDKIKLQSILTWYSSGKLKDEEAIEKICALANQSSSTEQLNKPAVSVSLQFLEPLCLTVKYALAFEFRALVEQMQDCKIKNVIEIKSCELLQYWIECPKEKENEITDMAFMTWIKNPVFQKYYHETRSFQEIAEKYVSEQCQQ